MRQIKIILFIFLPVFLILNPSDSISQSRLTNHHHSFYKDISDSTKVNSDNYKFETQEYKSPYIAGIMSFIIPGLSNNKAVTFYKILPDSSKPNSNNETLFLPQYKSPYLAGFLSFIIPGFGMGQFYNEQFVKGFIHLGITIGAACIIGFVSGTGEPDYGGIILGAGLLAANWVWSIADAVISAISINHDNDIKRKMNKDKWRIEKSRL
jgi:TM2 domain-containing membrane protein YozV